MKYILYNSNKILASLLLLATVFFSACDDELDKVNPNSVIVENFYSNTVDLTSAVNGIYAVLQDPQLVSREWFFINDLRGDDMETGGAQLETPRYQLLIGTNDNANFVAAQVFNGAYGVIHRANAVIEFAPDALTTSGKDDTLRLRLVGEAKWLRAWAYYELVVHWGSVPVYTETVKKIGDSKGLSPVPDVYALIVSDLKYAIKNLPLAYDGSDMGRVTKGAARALLARVYMHNNDYANARLQLDTLINIEKKYRLVDNYNDNFMEETEYNAESVFEVGFANQNGNYGWGYNHGNVQGSETTVHNQEINPLQWGNLIPSLSLLQDFEANDPRYKFSFYETGDTYFGGAIAEKDFNIASTTINGVTKKIGWRKHTILYKNKDKYYPSGNNERVIRYAEVLLMMAECLNETGADVSEILPYLNATRRRASVMMPPYPTAEYPTATYADRFKAVAHEKRIEFAAEEIRAKDLIRWRAQNKLGPIGGDPIAANKRGYLPIPQDEVNNNPNIQ
jgi:starch-binding outer membrane protein, SusD/RagB family